QPGAGLRHEPQIWRRRLRRKVSDRPMNIYLQSLWLCTLALAATVNSAEPSTKILFGKANDFRLSELQTHGVRAAVEHDRLRLDVATSDSRGERCNAIFPLHDEERNLAEFGVAEVDMQNVSSAPVVFTFWALSGSGWGGVSTYSTSK